MEIIKMEGEVLITKRFWWQLYKKGWNKHTDLWGGLWWIRYKWNKDQEQRGYSEEEVHNILKSYRNNKPKLYLKVFYDKWFEQFKKK
jgi:hypothetical protein